MGDPSVDVGRLEAVAVGRHVGTVRAVLLRGPCLLPSIRLGLGKSAHYSHTCDLLFGRPTLRLAALGHQDSPVVYALNHQQRLRPACEWLFEIQPLLSEGESVLFVVDCVLKMEHAYIPAKHSAPSRWVWRRPRQIRRKG